MTATIDFETYSEAGYYFCPVSHRWKSSQTGKPGISSVGSRVYAEHPSAEVLCLAYTLGRGVKLWTPDDPPPLDLFGHIAGGGLVEAWNSLFEYDIWTAVCVGKMGWPPLPLGQLRDASANARAWSLPGGLEKAGEALGSDVQKDKNGKRLIGIFCTPPRVRPDENPFAYVELCAYCAQDVAAESSISSRLPELTLSELDVWLADQRINARGVAVDLVALAGCAEVVRRVLAEGDARMEFITRGEVCAVSQVQKLLAWCQSRGTPAHSLAEECLAEILSGDIPDDVREALTLRSTHGSAAIKKLFAIERWVAADGRIHGVFKYYGASTGRWTGHGPQPQNLPNSGPDVLKCSECGRYYGQGLHSCPWCGACLWPGIVSAWCPGAVEDSLASMGPGVPLAVVSGCLRGLFVAGPGKDFICSDYSAIEAVVLAAVAGEDWRLEVFRTHGMIYETSAATITGVPFEEFVRHKRVTGEHHPLRNAVGKIAELASGYRGWVGAWKAFGAEKHIGDDDKIAECVSAWRAASPSIVALWHNLERCAISAALSPGHAFDFRGLSYVVKDDVLYCRLHSGRSLAYHAPRVRSEVDPYGRNKMVLSYVGNNTNPKRGGTGWIRIDTHGGPLTENVVQAESRDIMANAIVNLEQKGYPVVLHVHDEVVSEVPEGTGSVEEFEAIMEDLPAWAAGWPVRARGGWRGKRYRK